MGVLVALGSWHDSPWQWVLIRTSVVLFASTVVLLMQYEGGSVGVTPKDRDGFVEAVGVPLIRLGEGQIPS